MTLIRDLAFALRRIARSPAGFVAATAAFGLSLEGAECAARQGRFWEFHDWAFANQKELRPANVRAAADGIGLDMVRFDACLAGEVSADVQADIEFGDAVSVSGTPAWLIGIVQPDGAVKVTDRISGAKPFAEFQKILDRVTASVEDSGMGR